MQVLQTRELVLAEARQHRAPSLWRGHFYDGTFGERDDLMSTRHAALSMHASTSSIECAALGQCADSTVVGKLCKEEGAMPSGSAQRPGLRLCEHAERAPLALRTRSGRGGGACVAAREGGAHSCSSVTIVVSAA